jgi:hypothetical protein
MGKQSLTKPADLLKQALQHHSAARSANTQSRMDVSSARSVLSSARGWLKVGDAEAASRQLLLLDQFLKRASRRQGAAIGHYIQAAGVIRSARRKLTTTGARGRIKASLDPRYFRHDGPG